MISAISSFIFNFSTPVLKFFSSLRFSRYLKLGFLIWDLALLNVSYMLSFLLRFNSFEQFDKQEVQTILLFSNLAWIFLVFYYNAYNIIRFKRIESVLNQTVRLVLFHMGIIALVILTLKFQDVSRLRMLYFYTLFFGLLFLFRIVFIRALKAIRRSGYNYRNVLIIGANASGLHMQKILSTDLSLGFRVVGFFDDSPADDFPQEQRILGGLDQIADYVDENQVHEMYVALNFDQASMLNALIGICERNMIRIKFIPNFQQYTGSKKVTINFDADIPVMTLRREPLEIPINRLCKKAFDVCFSLAVILLVFPWLFPILMIAIKAGSPGPVFFRQTRSGEDNRDFTCLKFRTMRVNKLSDELQATAGDSRITKLGAFMRKTNLDELPQFFNVLIGDMSVVGPRPHMLKHTREYSELIGNYLVRHYAKPGITGWAQVNGYRGETKELIDMQKRVEYDIWYIENWSFMLDLKVIFLTIRNMTRGEKNAY